MTKVCGYGASVKKAWIGMGAALVAAAIAVVLVVALRTDPKDDALGACKEAVLQGMKSPSTANFTDELVRKDLDLPNAWEVYGSVDAQNSFGATVRNTFGCVVLDDDGDMTVDKLKFLKN